MGGPKARGFARILGITIADIDYLEATIRNGILVTPISSIRKGTLRGVNCVVELPVRGLGTRTRRMVNVRTVWEFATKDAVPRLVSAYLKP